MKKKRLLLMLAALGLIVSGALMLHPYPRQMVFGPKYQGVPLWVWQEDFRSNYLHDNDDPENSDWILKKILNWINKGRPSLAWESLLDDEKATIFLGLLHDPDMRVVKESFAHLSQSHAIFEAAFPKLEALLNHPSSEYRFLAATTMVNHQLVTGNWKGIYGDIHKMQIRMLDDPDSRVRLVSLDNLGQCCWSKRLTKIASPKLKALLQDPDAICRVAAARALWLFTKQTAGVLPCFRRELHNPDAQVRVNAIFGLRAMGKACHPALDDVVDLAFNDNDPLVRKEAIQTLPIFGRKTLPALISLLEYKDEDVQATAFRCIQMSVWDDAEVWPALLSALPDSEPLVWRILRSFSGNAAFPGLMAMLDNGHLTIADKKYLILMFGLCGAEAQAAVPKLSELLNDDDKAIQEASIIALARIGSEHEKVVTHLRESLGNANKSFSGSAYNYRPVAKEAVPVLKKLLHSKDFSDVKVAVYHLGIIGSEAKSAIPDLLRLLKDTRGSNGGSLCYGGLPFTSISVFESNVLQALGKMNHEGPTVVPALLPLLKNDNPTMRLVAIQTLACFRTQAKQAVPTLLEMIDNEADLISDAAADALSAIDPDRFPKKANGP